MLTASLARPYIALRNVCKQFPSPSGPFTALDNVSLDVERGEFIGIVGQSGSGKSTLLGALGGIDRVTSGEVHVAGVAVHALAERTLTAWRGRTVGIVFQFFQLIPTLTAVENVMLPMDFCGTYRARERRARALAIMDRLHVTDQADKLPFSLSGGQQQRVAVARALANEPAMLLADEPTGNLDSRTAAGMLELFAELAAGGQTIVMVTHERRALDLATRAIELADGRVVSADVNVGAHV